MGSLGCRDHEMVEFRILSGGRSAKSTTTTLYFRIAVFSLFRDVLGRIPGDMALDRRGIKNCHLILKDHILQAQEGSILPNQGNQAKEAGMDKQGTPNRTQT